MSYFETSAKDNVNIDSAFEEVAKLAFKRDLNDEVCMTNNKLIIDKNIKPKPNNNCEC